MDPTRRWLRLGVLAVVVIWLPVIVLWGRAPFAVTFDDAYYYFGVARNIAAGHGSTFDYVDKTNGYHPLWMAVCIIPYWLGIHGLAAVRTLLVAQLVEWAAALWALAALVTRAANGWPRLAALPDAVRAHAARRCALTVTVVLVLAGANPYVLKLFVNGLESGSVGVADSLLLLAVVASDVPGWFDAESTGRERDRRLLIGVLLSVAFLARTDSILLDAAFGAWCLPYAWHAARRGARPLVEVFALPALTLFAYCGLNIAFFGHALQISGVVKRLPITPVRAAEFGVAILAGAGLAALGRRAANARLERTSHFVASTAWFGGAAFVLVAYYHVLSVESYLWYYAPVAVWVIALLLHAAADLAEGAAVEAKVPDKAAAAIMPILAILAVPLLIGGVFTERAVADPHMSSLAQGDRAAAEWVRAHTPEGTVIASWDAGVIGYFSERPVVNLDGVVNSYAFRDAEHKGGRALSGYLRARSVELIVNHGFEVDGQDRDMRARVDELYGGGAGARLTLVDRVEYVYDGNLGGEAASGHLVATFVYEVAGEDQSCSGVAAPGGMPASCS